MRMHTVVFKKAIPWGRRLLQLPHCARGTTAIQPAAVANELEGRARRTRTRRRWFDVGRVQCIIGFVEYNYLVLGSSPAQTRCRNLDHNTHLIKKILSSRAQNASRLLSAGKLPLRDSTLQICTIYNYLQNTLALMLSSSSPVRRLF